MDKADACPHCGSRALYQSQEISSGGGHAPNYLPGLGKFVISARFVLVVCRDCGLTRFFAQPAARAKLRESSRWKAL